MLITRMHVNLYQMRIIESACKVHVHTFVVVLAMHGLLHGLQVAKAHIRAAEEDEKFRAQELAAHAEDAYMGRVHDTLRKTEPPIWHGFKKHQW